MMPAVVVTPVMVAPVAIVADAPRSVMSQDDTAAAVRVVIRVIVVVGVVGRSNKETPVKAMVPERDAAVSNGTTAEHGRASNPAALKYGATTPDAAAVNGGGASTAMVTASPAAVVAASPTTAAAMAATDFGRHSLRRMFGRLHRARIDQRQRLCALARYSRQRKQRGRRKPQGTDNVTADAAPGIWNLFHA